MSIIFASQFEAQHYSGGARGVKTKWCAGSLLKRSTQLLIYLAFHAKDTDSETELYFQRWVVKISKPERFQHSMANMTSQCCFCSGFSLKKIFFKFIDLREREEERKRERSIYCFIYLYIHWLNLVYTLTRDQTCNLSVLGQSSNQLSHSTRADWVAFLLWPSIYK